MEDNGKRDFFWPSYVDLMTSLFVVMLVLFILSYVKFSKKNKEYQASYKQMQMIKQIDSALAKLDSNSFTYDKDSKRHKLKVNVSFKFNSVDFNDIDLATKKDLIKAGRNLYQLMDSLTQSNKNVSYLLVVEGFAQRNLWNYKKIRDTGYVYSYKRSLGLVNYWISQGYDFTSKKRLANCELIIAGSGYFGNRDANENNNRRFTIQITPKYKVEEGG